MLKDSAPKTAKQMKSKLSHSPSCMFMYMCMHVHRHGAECGPVEEGQGGKGVWRVWGELWDEETETSLSTVW